MPVDPEIERFVKRQRKSAELAEREEIAALRLTTMEERGRMIEAAWRLAQEQVRASPHGDRMLDWSEPPHPSYAIAIARIRRENPNWRYRCPPDAPAPGHEPLVDE